MSKSILVIGYGPGISHAVAEAFGAEGFAVALAARSHDKLDAGKKKLEGKASRVLTQVTDAADPKSVRAFVDKARAELGGVDVLHYNAAGMGGAGDLLTATPEELAQSFAIGVTGLVVAVQAALADLKKANGAVLVTDGGLGLAVDALDDAGVQFKQMGLSIGNAAKHKAVRLLHRRLKTEGVYLGEVMVMGTVKGPGGDDSRGTIELAHVKDAFLKLWREKKDVSVQVK